jgi:hypothetical protein
MITCIAGCAAVDAISCRHARLKRLVALRGRPVPTGMFKPAPVVDYVDASTSC